MTNILAAARELLVVAKELAAADIDIDGMVEAFKKMRGVSRVKWMEGAGGGASMTVFVDGEPIEIEIHYGGDVTWDDFDHSTKLGNVSDPDRVVKTLLEGFAAIDDNRPGFPYEKATPTSEIDWFRRHKAR